MTNEEIVALWFCQVLLREISKKSPEALVCYACELHAKTIENLLTRMENPVEVH